MSNIKHYTKRGYSKRKEHNVIHIVGLQHANDISAFIQRQPLERLNRTMNEWMIYWTTKEHPTGHAGPKAEHMPKKN